ncbi:porin [Sulfolobus acidocaldarius SUSAZ]|nr:porin [Sulfolobus acidocaldarius SUSAZ]
MNDLFIILPTAIVMFFSMEFIARFVHKYVMHGFMWFIHKDHHRDQHGTFERNDLFGALFATVAAYLIFNGIFNLNPISLGLGIGMTWYGISYFLVHDMIIHDRHLHLRSWAMKHTYFRKLVMVHDVHHNKGKGNWGFLLVIRGLDEIPEGVDQV